MSQLVHRFGSCVLGGERDASIGNSEYGLYVKCLWVGSYGCCGVLWLVVCFGDVGFAREKGVNLASDKGCMWNDM
jgi:hypothetical protein